MSSSVSGSIPPPSLSSVSSVSHQPPSPTGVSASSQPTLSPVPLPVSVQNGGVCIGGKVYDIHDSRGKIITDLAKLHMLAAFISQHPPIASPGNPDIKHQISTGKLKRIDFNKTGVSIITEDSAGAEQTKPLFAPRKRQEVTYQATFTKIMQKIAEPPRKTPDFSKMTEDLFGKFVNERRQECDRLSTDYKQAFQTLSRPKRPSTQQAGGQLVHNVTEYLKLIEAKLKDQSIDVNTRTTLETIKYSLSIIQQELKDAEIEYRKRFPTLPPSPPSLHSSHSSSSIGSVD